MALGPIAGGAVKLTPNAEVSTALGIGEGIESTLSLRRILEFDESPVWALLSAGGVENFPVLSGIETLWIAVDNDSTGIKKAKSASSRWRDAGREVFCVQPVAAGNDLNDIITRGRE
jgi:putative DNA primase/helicase